MSKPRYTFRRGVSILAPLFLVAVAACSENDDLGGPDNLVPQAVVAAAPLNVPQNDGNQTVVTIDGSNSSDPDGDALTYAWTVPSGTFVNGTSATDAIIEVTFPGAAPYTVTLTVNDGNGGTDTAEVTIGII